MLGAGRVPVVGHNRGRMWRWHLAPDGEPSISAGLARAELKRRNSQQQSQRFTVERTDSRAARSGDHGPGDADRGPHCCAHA
jgi:hypothetical protein